MRGYIQQMERDNFNRISQYYEDYQPGMEEYETERNFVRCDGIPESDDEISVDEFSEFSEESDLDDEFDEDSDDDDDEEEEEEEEEEEYEIGE